MYLVGAGPGHPGLLTVRAKALLAKADVVVVDRLVSPRILGFAPSHARFIYVGKASGHHAMEQECINALLVETARQGNVVVRLKGGDPFVFGRGGEEASACCDADISFEVVPGVTSAVAVPAYAGIPLTYRTRASSFSVLTGHMSISQSREKTEWGHVRSETGTLVFLMGVENLEIIIARIRQSGRTDDTSVACVHWGTSASQMTITGTLCLSIASDGRTRTVQISTRCKE